MVRIKGLISNLGFMPSRRQILRAAFLLIILIGSTNANAQVGTVVDILDIQAQALGDASRKTSNQLAQNLNSQITNIYEIVSNDTVVDLSNSQALTSFVDQIFEHPVFQSRVGLATSLKQISDFSDNVNLANDIVNLGLAINTVRNAAKQFSVLRQISRNSTNNSLRLTILNNLLGYGAGNNDSYLQLRRNVELLLINTNQVALIQTLPEVLETIASSPGAIDAFVEFIKTETAAEQLDYLQSGKLSKLVVQEMVVQRWQQEGILSNSNLNQFNALGAYVLDNESCFVVFTCRTLAVVTAGEVFASDDTDTFSSEPLFDFELSVTDLAPNQYRVVVPVKIIKN
jgi:hypothetical protein